jgi:probable F420-dependent oxidoreductase
MKIGVVFPQIEFSSDPLAVRDYAQAAEELGYTHILAYDHVLGANPERPGGWNGPYTFKHPFLEPFILFSYMAGLTRTIQFTTGIIILPQRQTTLVAKQAATLDVLSSGRLRVGIGLGWNEVEYTSLNENFHNRGRRVVEQVEVLRLLWTQPLVNFKGRYHTIPDAGVNPLPVQRPIPLWFGGDSPQQIERAARLADGWMPNYRSVAEARSSLDALERHLAQAGRPRSQFGLEPRVQYAKGDPQDWETWRNEWQAAGATHLTVNTMGCGFSSPAAHIQAIQTFAKAMLS